MRCVIIGGAPDADISFIKTSVKDGDFIICADKGYEYALKAEIKPDLVIGDFDSCEAPVDGVKTIRLNLQKDDTDTIHCIDTALENGYDEIVLLASLGGRTDHLYANLSALKYIHTKGADGVILSEREAIRFLPCGEYEFNGYREKTFSVFPFGCDKVCVSYEGAQYPLNKYYLQSDFPLGVSNVFVSDNAKISIYDGNAILIINLLIN